MSSVDTGEADESTAGQLLDGAELLRVVRESIEWVLAFAHRLADGDPADVAAVERLRAAFQARLAGQPLRIRKTDLLIVLGIVLGALDPSIVVRTVSGTLSEGFAPAIEPEPPVMIHVTGSIDPLAAVMELLAALHPRRADRSSRPACPLRAHVR